MKLEKIRQKTDDGLRRMGLVNPDARWLVGLHLAVVLLGAMLYLGLEAGVQSVSFLLGAVLSLLNFYVLARIVPSLVWSQSGGIFSLLLGFYARLVGSGVILFLAIAWLDLPVLSLLAGLSTVLLTILIWFGKFVLTHKHKEA